ncbi:MAG: CBS domain-containing protein [Candidatus Helarchaeota archaeon]
MSELKARDLMKTDVISVYPDEKVAAVDLLMVRKSLGGVPVIDNETHKLVGIVTQRDIMLSRFRTSIAGMPIKNLMTKNPITVTPDTPIKELLGLMLRHRIERLPVIENGKLLGMIEPESILNTIYRTITN